MEGKKCSNQLQTSVEFDETAEFIDDLFVRFYGYRREQQFEFNCLVHEQRRQRIGIGGEARVAPIQRKLKTTCQHASNKWNNTPNWSFIATMDDIINRNTQIFFSGSTLKNFQRLPGSKDPAFPFCYHWLAVLRELTQLSGCHRFVYIRFVYTYIRQLLRQTWKTKGNISSKQHLSVQSCMAFVYILLNRKLSFKKLSSQKKSLLHWGDTTKKYQLSPLGVRGWNIKEVQSRFWWNVNKKKWSDINLIHY